MCALPFAHERKPKAEYDFIFAGSRSPFTTDVQQIQRSRLERNKSEEKDTRMDVVDDRAPPFQTLAAGGPSDSNHLADQLTAPVPVLNGKKARRNLPKKPRKSISTPRRRGRPPKDPSSSKRSKQTNSTPVDGELRWHVIEPPQVARGSLPSAAGRTDDGTSTCSIVDPTPRVWAEVSGLNMFYPGSKQKRLVFTLRRIDRSSSLSSRK